jgi:hypothetical protein
VTGASRRRRWVAAAAVVVLAAAVTLTVVLLGRGGAGPHPVHADGSAARAFTAAWRRSLEGTWTATGSSVTGGVTGSVKEVQRPPDRLTVMGAAVSGRVNGRTVSCVVDPTGTTRCHDGGPAPAYAGDVDGQVAVLTSEVGGPAPLYLVERDQPGCFTLRLAVAVAAPPYGDRGRFCFDPATGAPTRREITRGAVTDQQSFTSIAATVGDADLVLPAPLEP